MIEHKGLYIRENTYDKEIINEIKRTYEWMCPENENVLDVGACFGGYSVLAHNQKAKLIHCFEPEVDNFNMVLKNCENKPNIVPFNYALVSGDQTEQSFYLTTGKNKGNFSLTQFRGRKEIKVKCKKFNDVLENLKPSTIKMDCEGAEYDLLQKPLPDYVKKITIEIHFSKKHWRNDLAHKLISLFDDWKIHKKPLIGDKNWHTIGAWYR